MNRKKVLTRNFLICFLALAFYFATSFLFFSFAKSNEIHDLENFATPLVQALYEKKEDPGSVTSITYLNQDFHISFFADNQSLPTYDNQDYYQNNTNYIPQQQEYGRIVFGRDEFYNAESLNVTYYIQSQSVYLRLDKKLSQSYVFSKNLLIYGTVVFFLGDLAYYIVAYYSFIRDLRPLKLQVVKLQDIVKKNRVIEFEDDLDFLTSMIRDSRHELKHELEENQIGSQKIEFILDSFSQGLIVIDATYKIIIINKKALSIFNKTREDLDGRYINSLSSSHELEVNFSMVTHTKTPMTFIEKIDARVYQCDINPIDYAWTRNVIATQPNGASLLMIDVTDDYNSGEMKKEFFANASHELKSPLTSILGYLQLIQNGTLKDQAASQAIVKCIDDAHRMNKIISDMLSLSSLEKESLRPIEEISLPPFIESILSSLKIQAGAKKVSFMTSFEPLSVKINPDDLDRMIRNLIDNGIKYNREGGKLTVKTLSKERELIIQDTGIGISQENQARVFERFFRVDKARSLRNGGTGLGLAIVKHICNYYNLDISLESQLNQGTSFTIHFPE
jgi:two-component system phosphate regulon sensor histidine kinase PhoR